jgi:hypothetical protein
MVKFGVGPVAGLVGKPCPAPLAWNADSLPNEGFALNPTGALPRTPPRARSQVLDVEKAADPAGIVGVESTDARKEPPPWASFSMLAGMP